MPELPEVETMCDYLWPKVFHGKIGKVKVLRGKYLKKGAQIPEIEGQQVRAISRRGKFLCFSLEHGVLICHNAMSGFWDTSEEPWTFDYVEGKRTSKDSDVRVTMEMTDQNGKAWTVRFHDSRLFGSLEYFPGSMFGFDVQKLKSLGPDAIATAHSMYEQEWCILDVCMFNPKHEIKHALMDQSAVAGFGNIYATETCHMALIDPFKLCKDMNTDQWQRIFETGQGVLRMAVERKVDYSDLWCYRKSVCKICMGPILKKDLRGRSTYFCPACQK